MPHYSQEVLSVIDDPASLADDIQGMRDAIGRLRRGEMAEEEFRRFRLHRGIYGQRADQPSFNMIRVKVPYGLLSSGQLIQLGEIARRFADGLAHVTTRQEDINDLLILKAREGKQVVRLKGGDPFIFGRGGEELEAVREAGIDIEVVPGITAGTGGSTSLGIPLTHRRHASSVVFVTGHEDPTKNEELIDWGPISRCDTIVIYMGVKRLHDVVDQLLQNGVLPLKPVSVIFRGTLPEERVVRGRLRDIERKVDRDDVDSPGLIIVGNVVRFFDSQVLRQPRVDPLVRTIELHSA